MRVEDLYDYDRVRRLDVATLFVARVRRATLVLGGNQSSDILDLSPDPSVGIRRRRGGGGLVLLRPDDLWIDWWIPHGDPRWTHDVRESSIQVGTWWAEVLKEHTKDDVRVHEGALEGDPAFRLVCFAGRGPGEVFVRTRKAVGLTQWRVREGVFISTVLHAGPTADVLEFLTEIPLGLNEVLEHHTLSSLKLSEHEDVITRLVDVSGRWNVDSHLVI
ncbi:MAG: hypothetical protein ACRDVC_08030 [Acidimicrobiales bacterium]